MTIPLGGFMPIPLAMMIPFMATQSMVMGDAFGRAFQYGKRKISAMSNEEFNATSLEQQASEMFQSYRNIIPTLEHSIQDSQRLQEKIIREMLLILPRFAVSDELFKPEPFTVAGKSTIQDLISSLIPSVPEASATTGSNPTNITTTPKTPAKFNDAERFYQDVDKKSLQYWLSLDETTFMNNQPRNYPERSMWQTAFDIRHPKPEKIKTSSPKTTSSIATAVKTIIGISHGSLYNIMNQRTTINKHKGDFASHRWFLSQFRDKLETITNPGMRKRLTEFIFEYNKNVFKVYKAYA